MKKMLHRRIPCSTVALGAVLLVLFLAPVAHATHDLLPPSPDAFVGPTLPHRTTYTYDRAGNLLSDGKNTYTWDYDNHLSSVGDGHSTTTYGYDYTGQRTLKKTGNTTTITPNKYYELTYGPGIPTTTTNYIWAGDILIATVVGNGTATTTNYIHQDHLGSTGVVTDEKGDVVQVLDYYPYGSERISAGQSPTSRHYIGERLDSETGLSYLNARYYDSRRGQFISQDPVYRALGDPEQIQKLTGGSQEQLLSDPQALNSYSYARNNPIVNKDPEGKYVGTAFDVAMFSWSLRDYKEDPSFWNGFSVVADGVSIALPIPAIVGGLRHGDDVIKGLGVARDVAKQANWGNPGTLAKHFKDHGAQFGAKNAEDYARKATDFFGKVQKNGYQSVVGSDGTIRIYDPKTNTFGSYNPDGSTRTFFKPENGQKYWSDQVNDVKKNAEVIKRIGNQKR